MVTSTSRYYSDLGTSENIVQLDAIDCGIKHHKITSHINIINNGRFLIQIFIALHLHVVEEMLGLDLGED